MLDGEIQRLIADKGFGFIKPATRGADVFFHSSVVNAPFETLTEGQAVKYELDAKADKPKASSVQAGACAPNRRPSRSIARPSSNSHPRDTGQIPRKHGFVTKLHGKKYCGFISSIEHGPEFLFAAASVSGDKRFSRLEIGDYVEFLVGKPSAEDPKQPVAIAVKVVEREVKHDGNKQLSRHPKARKKKPSWR